MLIQTRARKLKERKDQRDLTVAESIPARSPESEHEEEITPNPEPKPPTENEGTTVDSETNRIFVGENLLNGTLPKETYLKLLNSKFAVKDCIKIMMLIAKCVLRKMNIKLTETLLEAEAWRVMIRTSQP